MKEKLLKILEAKGVSQAELAERIGMVYNTFNRKVNGNQQFKSEEMKAIAKELGLTTEEFYDIFVE